MDHYLVYLLDMKISVTKAKGQLTELVRRAERGDEVVLTRHGRPAVRLVAVPGVVSRQRRRAILDAVRSAGKMRDGATAARSQDFLYDERGLPE